MTVEELQIAWAQKKYGPGLSRVDKPATVTKVEFEIEPAWDYSELTAGDPALLKVVVTWTSKSTSGRTITHRHEDFSSYETSLISEILEFALHG